MAKEMARMIDGVIVNIEMWSDSFGETDTLIDLKNFKERSVGIGDTFEDGRFYRDGVEILTPLEEARKRIAELEAENADKTEALEALYSGVSE